MDIQTELFHWWVVDEATGELQLTRFKLSRENAQRAFPGAQPDLPLREVHDLIHQAEQTAGRQGAGDDVT